MTIIQSPQRRGPGRPRKSLGPSGDSIFLARHAPAAEVSATEYQNADTAREDTPLTAVEVMHTRAGRVRMWALTSTGSVPRWIDNNGNHLKVAMDCGLSPVCHDCQGEHGDGINECPGREPRRYRPCPVCPKKLYDPKATGMAAVPGTTGVIGFDSDGLPIVGTVAEDPNAISNADLGNSTPETRTNMLVYRHMSAFHKSDVLVFFPNMRAQEEQVKW